jgi:glycogen debranching enzyme
MATTGNSGPRQTLDGGAGSYEASFRRVSGWNQGWLEQATVFETDNPDLNEMLERARRDIAMLLTASPCSDDGSSQTYVAAGIPWYVALFGRDSLIAARDCLLLQPSLAVGILRLLARYQGKQDDPWRDEAPGKILHELRVGELARMNDIPHTPYYGTVDATPLWLMLLHDTYCWTHDRALLEELWLNALAALGWIDRGLASSPNGFLCYEAHPGKGLTHQGWKDSGDSAMYEDGRPAHAPLALAEVQGYVYQAKVRLAALAELRDETSLAIRLRDEAREFKRRFNQAFWQEDLGFCALALDGQGAPLRVVASNPGHCLEADLLTPPLAERVAARLMEPDMFNGWGIRTLSSQAVAYNPMSYHNGSVWPHDNALIARGFAAMGRGEFALKIFGGLFDAGRLMFYKRLPELFCGFARDFEHDVNPPVRYPVACSPQAWAASSVFALLQSLLNLRPVLDSQALRIREPQLPTGVNRLKLRRLRVGASLLDLEFKRTDKTVTVEIRERQGPVSIVL